MLIIESGLLCGAKNGLFCCQEEVVVSNASRRLRCTVQGAGCRASSLGAIYADPCVPSPYRCVRSAINGVSLVCDEAEDAWVFLRSRGEEMEKATNSLLLREGRQEATVCLWREQPSVSMLNSKSNATAPDTSMLGPSKSRLPPDCEGTGVLIVCLRTLSSFCPSSPAPTPYVVLVLELRVPDELQQSMYAQCRSELGMHWDAALRCELCNRGTPL